jgi:hypothetical protein
MGRKVYEVYIEKDIQFPENENWVIYSGSKRMASAFKEGATFFSAVNRRIKIRERNDDGEKLREEEEPKIHYNPNTNVNADTGRYGGCDK